MSLIGCLLSSDPKQQALLEARLKQKEEACREAEQRRVEVELRLVEVNQSLKKVESGPFTLGTTLDSSLQDTPTVCDSFYWYKCGISEPHQQNLFT